MATQANAETDPSDLDSYTYLQFVISEITGQIAVNFIDEASGRVVRHIPAEELAKIVRDHNLLYGFQTSPLVEDECDAKI